MEWLVYLSGEIHTDWRKQIEQGARAANLPVKFCSAVTDHAASDGAGDVLGPETEAFWRDHKSSKVNAMRTRTLIEHADVAVVRFGDKYKQWNAAFDAGICAALMRSCPRVAPSAPHGDAAKLRAALRDRAHRRAYRADRWSRHERRRGTCDRPAARRSDR